MKKTSRKTNTVTFRCVWGLLCSLSSIDQERNNISLFNVLEQINVPKEAFVAQEKEKKPIFIQYPHELVLLFRRSLKIEISNEELLADIRISTVDPNGIVLQQTLSPFKFIKDKKRMRFRFQANGFVISTPGDYVYRIEVKDESDKDFRNMLEVPFEVVVVRK